MQLSPPQSQLKLCVLLCWKKIFDFIIFSVDVFCWGNKGRTHLSEVIERKRALPLDFKIYFWGLLRVSGAFLALCLYPECMFP